MRVDMLATTTHGKLYKQIAQLMQCKLLSKPEEGSGQHVLSAFVEIEFENSNSNLVTRKLHWAATRQLRDVVGARETSSWMICSGSNVKQLVILLRTCSAKEAREVRKRIPHPGALASEAILVMIPPGGQAMGRGGA